MRTKFFAVVFALTMSSVTLTSCLGSFALTNNVLEWNRGVTDNKFVNQVVFWALNVIPVYSATVFIDAVILNLIEFWTGDNPLAMGDTKLIEGENGTFLAKVIENGYQITSECSEVLTLVNHNNVWSYSLNGAEKVELVKIYGDVATVFMPNGEEMQVELSVTGILALQQSLEIANDIAMN